LIVVDFGGKASEKKLYPEIHSVIALRFIPTLWLSACFANVSDYDRLAFVKKIAYTFFL